MTTYVRTQEIEHEIGERGRLALRVTSPDVEMRAVDGGTARVRITFEIRAASDAAADEILERASFGTDLGAGSLAVVEPKRAQGIGSLAHLFGGSSRFDTRVAVEAPRGCDVRYEGVSSDLTATGFRGEQQYRTVSGDLVLDQTGGDLRVKGVSSTVSLRAEAPLASLEINTVSGDVSAVAPRVGELRVVTVSGDIELETTLADGPVHRVETVSGDLALGVDGDLSVEVRGISTDVDITVPHRSEGSRDRRRYIIGSGGPTLTFSSMSGDVEVRGPRRAGAIPASPRPPAPPAAPSMGVALPGDDEQLAVLRALERGEIDVDEAARRLTAGADSDV